MMASPVSGKANFASDAESKENILYLSCDKLLAQNITLFYNVHEYDEWSLYGRVI